MNSLSQYITADTNPNCAHVCLYKGIRCAQTPRVLNALDTLQEMCKDDMPKRILEIGTLYGGFTQLLRDHSITTDATMHSFDIKNTLVREIGSVDFINGDVFGNGRQQLIDLITAPGRVILMCDGGDKEREVREFCAFLKPNDIIMCHDYVKDVSLVGTPAVGDWVGYETLYVNIKDALKTNNCEAILEEVMQMSMWGCFIRKV
jgi:cephalosporin hydroxylase